jgi:hypothetical protein
MDCADRIAIQTAERALVAVRSLGEIGPLSAVTVRTLLAGRRLDVTVTKRRPDGPDGAPRYRWAVREVDGAGGPLPGGLALDGRKDEDGPEEAYWAAGAAAGSLPPA